jgi:hypothetical protein
MQPPGNSTYPGRVTHDQLLHDAVAFEEIELYGDMVIAASAHERPLTYEELDTALGLVRSA